MFLTFITIFLTVMFATAGVSTHNTGETSLLQIKKLATAGVPGADDMNE